LLLTLSNPEPIASRAPGSCCRRRLYRRWAKGWRIDQKILDSEWRAHLSPLGTECSEKEPEICKAIADSMQKNLLDVFREVNSARRTATIPELHAPELEEKIFAPAA
jgi:hypothetical protein